MNHYEKMCEAAQEVQRWWKPQYGDRFYLKTKINTFDHSYEEGVHFVPPSTPNKVIKNSFWLPYSHDIQNLILKTLKSPNTMVVDFWIRFIMKNKQILKTYTIEESWLLYYYYKIHNKIWDGNDWVDMEIDIYTTDWG
jgi:hypothetical protein